MIDVNIDEPPHDSALSPQSYVICIAYFINSKAEFLIAVHLCVTYDPMNKQELLHRFVFVTRRSVQ
jgi:hypothetical protein